MKIKKNIAFFVFMVYNLISSKVFAEDIADPTQIEPVIDTIKEVILEYVKPLSSILLFLSIIIIGLNIIIKRNKPDERTGAMMGLMTIAIGCFILGSAGLIYSFIMSLVG